MEHLKPTSRGTKQVPSVATSHHGKTTSLSFTNTLFCLCSLRTHLLRSQPVGQGHGYAQPARHDRSPQAQLQAPPRRRRYRPRNANVHPSPPWSSGGVTPLDPASATGTCAIRFRGYHTPHNVRKRPDYKAKQRDPVTSSPGISQERLHQQGRQVGRGGASLSWRAEGSLSSAVFGRNLMRAMRLKGEPFAVETHAMPSQT